MTDTAELEARVAALESRLGLVQWNFNQLLSWVQSNTALREKTDKAAEAIDTKFHTSIIDV